MRHVVISSGSRCAPLVLAAGHHDGLRKWTNPDERSAAFCALGIAKATLQPAALICTSGTAVANYLPAIIEAKMSGTPMVVITADRPPRLRNVGAPQAIDQVDIYGGYVAYSEDLPVSSDANFWREAAARAVRRSIESCAPAHLNAPFDEPLFPSPDATARILTEDSAVAAEHAAPIQVETDSPEKLQLIDEIGALLARSRKALIVCGPHNDRGDLSTAVLALAERIGATVLADVASNVRRLPAAISHYDLALRDPGVRERLAPDLILRIGGLPTSKSLNEWIASTPAASKIGIANGAVADPDLCLTHALPVEPGLALNRLMSGIKTPSGEQTEYRDLWNSLEDSISDVLVQAMPEAGVIFEPEIVAQVCKNSGADVNLFLSSSMPIRWADMYAPAHPGFPRVIVNRGANGIDGIVSTAAGVARSSAHTTVCILGDLTFLHDSNGLWRLCAEHVPLKLIVLNNDGGGVFHFLPIAAHSNHFENLVAMPHGIEISHLAAAHGITYNLATSPADFGRIFDACLTRPGPEIIEVRTDRAGNHKRHQQVIEQVKCVARETLGLA